MVCIEKPVALAVPVALALRITGAVGQYMYRCTHRLGRTAGGRALKYGCGSSLGGK